MDRLRTLLIFGTRPEAIKMAPVVHECQRRNNEIEPIVCLTGQHREMLDQVTDYFGISADTDLELMTPNQTLAELTARCVEGIDEVIGKYKPDCVVAQGDTTTLMAASLAGFYRKLPFVHVEAGMRTGNLYAPWPEELNRRIADLTAALHCAPSELARDHLLSEGADPSTVHLTGNTVIDALLWTVERERANSDHWRRKYAELNDHRMVLVTAHRRESFGGGFQNICQALTTLTARFPDVRFIYPVHLNPKVQKIVRDLLGNCPNIRLQDPAPYPEFVWLMDRSTIILTDSGGVQEEAPSLHKPTLVMREVTERPEALQTGAVKLVGTCTETIIESASTLLEDEQEYARFQVDENPYGDGKSAVRIVELMLKQAWHRRM